MIKVTNKIHGKYVVEFWLKDRLTVILCSEKVSDGQKVLLISRVEENNSYYSPEEEEVLLDKILESEYLVNEYLYSGEYSYIENEISVKSISFKKEIICKYFPTKSERYTALAVRIYRGNKDKFECAFFDILDHEVKECYFNHQHSFAFFDIDDIDHVNQTVYYSNKYFKKISSLGDYFKKSSEFIEGY